MILYLLWFWRTIIGTSNLVVISTVSYLLQRRLNSAIEKEARNNNWRIRDIPSNVRKHGEMLHNMNIKRKRQPGNNIMNDQALQINMNTMNSTGGYFYDVYWIINNWSNWNIHGNWNILQLDSYQLVIITNLRNADIQQQSHPT